MYAIIRVAGKQYRVDQGSTIAVDKLRAEVGEEVILKEALVLNMDGETKVGSPYVKGARIVGKVVRHFKDEKIDGFTYKAKKNVARRYGHRQQMTELSIEKIELEK